MDNPEDNPYFRFFTEVGIIHQLITNTLQANLPDRMSSTQFGLLGHLARRPEGETPLQLAHAFQVPKTTITHMISGLEKRKLVKISTNPRDARSKIVIALPEAGKFLAEKTALLGKELAPIIASIGVEPFVKALPELEIIRKSLDQARDP